MMSCIGGLHNFCDVAGHVLSLPTASVCKQILAWFGALEVGLSALLTIEVWVQKFIVSSTSQKGCVDIYLLNFCKPQGVVVW